jgi:hypothetical protein
MIPDDVRQRLRSHGHDHLLEAMESLAEPERANLLRELERIDLA